MKIQFNKIKKKKLKNKANKNRFQNLQISIILSNIYDVNIILNVSNISNTLN